MSLAAGFDALIFSVLNPFAFVSLPLFLIGFVGAFRIRLIARTRWMRFFWRALGLLFAICPVWFFVFAAAGNELELTLSSASRMGASFVGAPFGIGWLLGWLAGEIAQASTAAKSAEV